MPTCTANWAARISTACANGVPARLTVRGRVFPSGRPDEESSTLVCRRSHLGNRIRHFKTLCQSPCTNVQNDSGFRRGLNELMAA